MKRFILSAAIFCSLLSLPSFAQDVETPSYTQAEMIEAFKSGLPELSLHKDVLTMTFQGHEWTIKKNQKIMIGLPAKGSQDFITLEKKKGFIGSGLAGAVAKSVANVAGAGVGLGAAAGSLSGVVTAAKTAATAASVADIAYSVDNLANLAISQNAKSIAGNIAVIKKIKKKGEEYELTIAVGKQKFIAHATQAILLGEIIVPTVKK